jgi:VanZ family protein
MSKQTGLFSIVITLASLFFIFIITLFPLEFSFKETLEQADPYSFILGKGETDRQDVMANILLFIPFGLGLGGVFWRKVKFRLWKMLGTIFITCFVLSYSIELLQIFQPGRFPSIYDVLSNSTGGLFGTMCFLLWEHINLRKRFLVYVSVTYIISVPLQMQTNLSNWDITFPLLIGNELTEDRPWNGYISDIFIADKALLKDGVSQTFSEGKLYDLFSDSLVALYHMDSSGNFHDETGHLPDIVGRRESWDIQQLKGGFVNHNNWLHTAMPVEYLTQRVKHTSQFTLGITVASDDVKQSGPARIISVSKDTVQRNFTLGQQETDLVVRVRTPLTGDNGANPQLIVPAFFPTEEPKNLIVTYNGSVLRLYVDRVSNFYEFEFTPLAALFSYYFNLQSSHLRIYKILYYVTIFMPLGILLALIIDRMDRLSYLQTIGIVSGILLLSLMLEGLLLSISGKHLSFNNILIGFMFTFICLSLTRLFHLKKL